MMHTIKSESCITDCCLLSTHFAFATSAGYLLNRNPTN
jgi:hypothetical protein